MTDTELLRWAAEECLGYGHYIRPDGGSAYIHSGVEHRSWWERIDSDGNDDDTLCECDLTGWPGFGLAVEAARARDLMLSFYARPGDVFKVGIWGVREWKGSWEAVAGGTNADPGIAAWRALYEATGGGK